jgi:lipopolysaccharide transport system permease protein
MVSKFFDLILFRAVAELKSEGTRTYAGYLWWIIEPLMSLAVYYVAFRYIFHRTTGNFAIFLFIGIVVYRFFAGTVTRSALSIYTSKGLMQLVYVHKSVFPLSVIVVNLVKFLITLILVVIVTWFAGIAPTGAYMSIPILIAVGLLFITGVSMICAAITPFFPDFQMVLGTIIHLLFFLSGVLFDPSGLSQRMQTLVRLNPIAVVIEQFRAILLYGTWPNFTQLLPALGWSILFLAFGWMLIHRFDRYFPKLS